MMRRIILEGLRWATRKLDLVAYLTAENLTLRQQLLALKCNQKRPQIRKRDRMFWVGLSRAWSSWREALLRHRGSSYGRVFRERAPLLDDTKALGHVPGGAVIARQPFGLAAVPCETHSSRLPFDGFSVVIHLIHQVTAYRAAAADFFIRNWSGACFDTVQEVTSMTSTLVEFDLRVTQELFLYKAKF